MDDGPQFQVVTSAEATTLEGIAARIMDNLQPREFTYHTSTGVDITFKRPLRKGEPDAKPEFTHPTHR